MVEQLRRDIVNVQAPQFDLAGYLGYGGHGGVGAGGRVIPTQFAGVNPGDIMVGGARGGGGGYEMPERQPSAFDFLTAGFGKGMGEGLAVGIPEKMNEFLQQQKRQKSISAIDAALSQVNPNDRAGKLDAILHANADDETKQLALEYENAKDEARAAEEQMKLAKQQQEAYGEFLNQQMRPQPRVPNANESVGIPPQTDMRILSPQQQKEARQIIKDEREFEQKERHSRKASEELISTDILKGVEKMRPTVPQQKAAAAMIKQAVLQGDLAGVSKDFLADVLHYEPFRSTEGALFKTAGKEYFLSSVNSIGGKPNQWVEQQIMSMMPQIGRSREANMTVAEAMQQDADLKEKTVEVYDNLAKQYRDTLGYVPAEIGKAANAILKPYAEERQRQTAYQMRVIKEQENPNLLGKVTKVVKGTPLTLRNAQALLEKYNGDAEKAQKVALSLGYEIPDETIYSLKSPYDLSIASE